MGQDDVKEWLEEQRKQGIDDYFTASEIRQGLIDKGCNGSSNPKRIYDALAKLSTFNIIEDVPINRRQLFRRKFRFKT